jgi:hypothetical protein
MEEFDEAEFERLEQLGEHYDFATSWAIEPAPHDFRAEVADSQLLDCVAMVRRRPIFDGPKLIGHELHVCQLPGDGQYTWLDLWKAADNIYRQAAHLDPDHCFIETLDKVPCEAVGMESDDDSPLMVLEVSFGS